MELLPEAWVFWNLIVPAGAGLVACLGIATIAPQRVNVAGVAGLMAGVLAAHLITFGWPTRAPLTGVASLPLLVLPLGALVSLATVESRRVGAWCSRIVFALAAPATLLAGVLRWEESLLLKLAGVLLPAAVFFVLSELHRSLTHRVGGGGQSLARLALVAAGAGLANAGHGSVSLGLITWGLAATLGGLAVLATVRELPVPSLLPASDLAFTAIAGCLVLGVAYSSLPAWLAIAILASPLAASTLRFLPGANDPVRAAKLRMALVACSLAAVLTPTVLELRETLSGY